MSQHTPTVTQANTKAEILQAYNQLVAKLNTQTKDSTKSFKEMVLSKVDEIELYINEKRLEAENLNKLISEKKEKLKIANELGLSKE